MHNPPRTVRFQGHVYRRVEAVMPAKAAEVKVRQLLNATGRAPSAKLVNLDEWDVDEKGLLAATNTKDGGKPMLVMWNPVTAELLMSSDKNLNIVHHWDLFKKLRPKLKDYPLPHVRDWVRASVEQDSKRIRLWPWEPLLEHIVYLQSSGEQRQMNEIHSKANRSFERLISELGSAGYSFSTINL